jgi:hypothetical protein
MCSVLEYFLSGDKIVEKQFFGHFSVVRERKPDL